jgi:hypothetical protein
VTAPCRPALRCTPARSAAVAGSAGWCWYQQRQRRCREDREGDDQIGGKPVVALALVKHDLESTKPKRNLDETDKIDPEATPQQLLPFPLGRSRLLHEHVDEELRDNPHRHVDEEDPVPAGHIDNPAAERGTYSGRHDHAPLADLHRGDCPCLWTEPRERPAVARVRNVRGVLLGLPFGLAQYVRAPLPCLSAMVPQAREIHHALRMLAQLAARMDLRPMNAAEESLRQAT